MCPKIDFSAIIQAVWGFSTKKNLKAVFGTPFPTEKVLLGFVIRCVVSSKMVMPRSKIIFWDYFGKYCFFF